MNLDNYMQRFGEDAIHMRRYGWKFIDSSRPGKGLCKEFIYKGYRILVLILPSVGYPKYPPVVVLVSDDINAINVLQHPCLWRLDHELISKLQKDVRRVIEEYPVRKTLHLREDSWNRLSCNGVARNILAVIHTILINNIGLKPADKSLWCI